MAKWEANLFVPIFHETKSDSASPWRKGWDERGRETFFKVGRVSPLRAERSQTKGGAHGVTRPTSAVATMPGHHSNLDRTTAQKIVAGFRVWC